MGYSANFSGYVTLKAQTPDAKTAEITQLFEECGDVSVDAYTLDISGDDKYHDEEWYRALLAAAPFAEKGEISFIGEDYALWQFRFDGGLWYEDYGHIEYTPGELLNKKVIDSNSYKVNGWKRHREWPEDRCPRCGASMPDKSSRAISRIADCEICSTCRTAEALIACETKAKVELVDDWKILKG